MKPSRIYKPHIDAYAVNNLARQDPQKLIDFSEDRYRSQISEVAEEFAAGFPHSRIILLSGPTSSGKTTTSHNLDAELEKGYVQMQAGRAVPARQAFDAIRKELRL